jgi:hypothetical protein
MKLPRRNFLHLAAGAAALPAVSRIARALVMRASGMNALALAAIEAADAEIDRQTGRK